MKKQTRVAMKTKLAAPVRDILSKLLREKLTDRADILNVARSLKTPVRTLEGVVYSGRGSFDLIISAFLIAYNFDQGDLEKALRKFVSKNR